MPEAWPQLQQLAEGPAAQTNPRAFQDSLLPLGRMIQAMDMTPLEANYFYASRLAIREFAQVISPPDVQERIIEEGADLLITQSTAARWWH